jgi:NAD(P)-dependent dehydrogenase (short-subunit alcohol dehydrogenase family)
MQERTKTWFVTGAASGFGHAMGLEVLGRGENLVAADRDVEGLGTFDGQSADRVMIRELDVTQPEAVRAAFDEAVTQFSRIDVVFNNAGQAGYVGAVEELTDDQFRGLLENNLVGNINVLRAALPHLRRQRSGHVLQMSSLNGVEGLAGGAFYAASKFGIEGLSESLADEVAHLGIKVTIVEPGPHRTGFLAGANVKWAEEIDDYADSVGQTRQQLRELDGSQSGDPVRAVRAMIQAVESDDPPQRLPLGAMALKDIREKLRAQLHELEAWSGLSATSDFPKPSNAEA